MFEIFLKIKLKLIIILFFIFFISGFNCCFAVTSNIKNFDKTEMYSKIKAAEKNSPKTMKGTVEIIDNYISNEQYTEAMLDLNRLLAEGAFDPRIYVLSSTLLRKTYQFDEAEKMAKKALQLDYKNSSAYIALGYVFFDRARMSLNSEESAELQRVFLTRCFDHFFMASQYDPANPLPHIALAEAYTANGQKGKATDEILKAKELSFGNTEAYYQLGDYYYRIKDNEKAVRYLSKALEGGKTGSFRPYYMLANILEQNGKIKEAQKTYLKALELKPDLIEAQQKLDSLIKTAYREKQETSATPKNLFSDVNQELNILLKADYYVILDEYTKARELYIKLIEKNPQNTLAISGLAELYYSKWAGGFVSSQNFSSDAMYILKAKVSPKTEISFLKFEMINEDTMPEKVRQRLINLSISESFDFQELLNEVRAEFLLGNFEECHNKLYKMSELKLSNYEKFKILKYLVYDHNYYEALILIEDMKKTHFRGEEIETVETRVKAKLKVAEEKINDSLALWEQKNYDKAKFMFREIMRYFPASKQAYFHYGKILENEGDYLKSTSSSQALKYYNEAYNYLNICYKLYQLYPEKDPDFKISEIKKQIEKIYIKIKDSTVKND